MSYELNAGGKQLAEVIEKVTWSGDSKQVARKLVFTVANKDSDRFLPKVNINEGDQVQFLEDGKLLFSGPVFDIEKSGSGNVVTYTAFDLMFYVTKSDINRVFDNETPEAITSWICSQFICHGWERKRMTALWRPTQPPAGRTARNISP